jgi:hypothetical protein
MLEGLEKENEALAVRENATLERLRQLNEQIEEARQQIRV